MSTLRLRIWIFLVVVIFSSTHYISNNSILLAAESGGPIVRGDIDQDGLLTPVDLPLFLEVLEDPNSFVQNNEVIASDDLMTLADFNRDGMLDRHDLLSFSVALLNENNLAEDFNNSDTGMVASSEETDPALIELQGQQLTPTEYRIILVGLNNPKAMLDAYPELLENGEAALQYQIANGQFTTALTGLLGSIQSQSFVKNDDNDDTTSDASEEVPSSRNLAVSGASHPVRMSHSGGSGGSRASAGGGGSSASAGGGGGGGSSASAGGGGSNASAGGGGGGGGGSNASAGGGGSASAGGGGSASAGGGGDSSASGEGSNSGSTPTLASAPPPDDSLLGPGRDSFDRPDLVHTIVPGSGFSGPTPTPPAIGSGFGSDAKVIGRWDVVPYQTFDDNFEVGVVAFHINGIDRVEFSADGGPWTSVSEMTLNPRTNVVEYWATLRASDFSDGSIEVRAVSYPTVGIPRVQTQIILNANANGTLDSIARYVSPTGSDTSGDGTATKPFRSIMKAARSIRDASTTNTADGGIVYLTAGDHRYGAYSFSLAAPTVSRWLTITPAPGLTKSQVRLVDSDGNQGLNTFLVHLKNIIVQPLGSDLSVLRTGTQIDSYIWMDNTDMIGQGSTVPGDLVTGWNRTYSTGSLFAHSVNGLGGGSVVRDTVVSHIGSDAYSNSKLLVNSSADNMDRGNTSFPPRCCSVLPWH